MIFENSLVGLMTSYYQIAAKYNKIISYNDIVNITIRFGL